MSKTNFQEYLEFSLTDLNILHVFVLRLGRFTTVYGNAPKTKLKKLRNHIRSQDNDILSISEIFS